MKDHSKRALRRHHRDRIKRKRASYYWWWECVDGRRLGMVTTTACLCSCSACGNPRRNGWDKKHTIQERKYFQESIEESLEEV